MSGGEIYTENDEAFVELLSYEPHFVELARYMKDPTQPIEFVPDFFYLFIYADNVYGASSNQANRALTLAQERLDSIDEAG